ncbi:MAG: methionine adenosyltransferase [Deferrisomatales bacterium]
MIIVEVTREPPAAERPVEVVERKGLGHPDTICDAVMEAVSQALCREYRAAFGTVLHHNVDKALLAAGAVEKRFGGGKVLRPMELTLGDRATLAAEGRTVPVGEIAVETARSWFREHLRFVDPDRHLSYRVALAPGSAELTGIFATNGHVLDANDTSAAVGFYPLTATERLVLELERHLNSRPFKNRFPESGEDVKVMAVRRGNALDVTLAMPLLCPMLRDEKAYFGRKEEILEAVRGFVARAGFEAFSVHYNALDRPGAGIGGTYSTLLGTSAEDADSGQVGRGNRVNGLISVTRPLGTEAAAGKNPVSHVGKIYNVLAHRAARAIYERVEGVREAWVLLVSRIGQPVNRPARASARIHVDPQVEAHQAAGRAEEALAGALEGVGTLCEELSRGVHPVW